MATTTNYSWTTPDDSDPFKQGASAIRTLGSSIDTTLGTALGGTYPGLRLVKKQTIDSGVSSVTVNDAFNSTYENYKVLISGGVGSTSPIYLTLRLDSVTTGYYGSLIFSPFGSNATPSSIGTNNGANFIYVGIASTVDINAEINLVAPSLPKRTRISFPFFDETNNGFGGGVCASTNAHTSFTIVPTSGTLTGGTIYVYGYGAS